MNEVESSINMSYYVRVHYIRTYRKGDRWWDGESQKLVQILRRKLYKEAHGYLCQRFSQNNKFENGLEFKVKYICCDNAGEHQQDLLDYCKEVGIVLEYTAPITPKQNGRVEKKIHVIWQHALTMINANLTLDSQKVFWAEAVACSVFIEDVRDMRKKTEPTIDCLLTIIFAVQ